MITLLEVKTQMAQCIENRNSATKPGEISKLKKKYAFLKLIHDYLLESPSSDYINFTLKRLDHNLQVINQRFIESLKGRSESEFAKTVFSELRKKFDKEYDVKKLKEQLRAVKSS